MPPPKAIATPCVQVCAVDGESGLCLGCFRTLAEIAGWSRFTDAERAALMAELPPAGPASRPPSSALSTLETPSLARSREPLIHRTEGARRP